jgi:glutamate dehydrogenase/leucine dehydrogenase
MCKSVSPGQEWPREEKQTTWSFELGRPMAKSRANERVCVAATWRSTACMSVGVGVRVDVDEPQVIDGLRVQFSQRGPLLGGQFEAQF